MIKRILLVVMLVLIAMSIYVVLHAKSWAMVEIKKQISLALDTKSVTLKDLTLPFTGPIIVTGLSIKKSDTFALNVKTITLDKGVWSIISGSTGTIQINSFTINKVRLSDVSVNFWFKNKDVIVHVVDGKVLKGTIKANATLKLLKVPSYEADMTLSKISLPNLINDFKLQKKVSITGLVDGDIAVKGAGKAFTVINGYLDNSTGGGELIIEDMHFLKQMVKNMKLDKFAGSEELFVASLKHYLYNKLHVTLNLIKGDLILDAVLEGDSGKRSFPIVYHDFTLERLGL